MMGRSFESVRQGIKGPIDRWDRAAQTLKMEDLSHGRRVAALARLHSSEAFYGCDDPLEAAVFSVLVEMVKQQDPATQAREDTRVSTEKEDRDVDP